MKIQRNLECWCERKELRLGGDINTSWKGPLQNCPPVPPAEEEQHPMPCLTWVSLGAGLAPSGSSTARSQTPGDATDAELGKGSSLAPPSRAALGRRAFPTAGRGEPWPKGIAGATAPPKHPNALPLPSSVPIQDTVLCSTFKT